MGNTLKPIKPATVRAPDFLDRILAWEGGEMDSEEELAFFKELVSSGMIHQLQGMYGRRAHALGLI